MSKRVNNKRGMTRYRHMNAIKARRIRELYWQCRLTQSEIAWWYGISQKAVSRIICNETWPNARFNLPTNL